MNCDEKEELRLMYAKREKSWMEDFGNIRKITEDLQEQLRELRTDIRIIYREADFWGRACARLLAKNKELEEQNEELKAQLFTAENKVCEECKFLGAQDDQETTEG